MLQIFSIQKRMTGYGYWRITLELELSEEYLLEDGPKGVQIYSSTVETGNIICITTNSRAIDGHDGGDRALASECLRYNGRDEDDYDMSTLDGGDDEDEDEDF